MSTEKKGKAAAPAAPVAAKAKPEAVIYVGPTLPRGQLHKNALFLGGQLPAHVEQLCKANEDLAALFVPVSKLGAVQIKLQDPASAEVARIRRVAAAFSK